VKGGKVFQADVPTNWYALSSQSSIKFVPKNGYGQLNGQSVFTHGAEVGVMRAQSGDLSEATDAVLQSLASGNPELRDVQPPRQVQLSQRTAIHHQLTNRSATADREQVNFVTTFPGGREPLLLRDRGAGQRVERLCRHLPAHRGVDPA
jgi:hypothetical protein